MNRIGGAIQSLGAKVLRLNLPYSTAGQGNIDDAENLGWTPLTVGNRELPTYQQDRMFAIAAHLYRRNAMAHRIIEVTKAFVVGEGIILKATNPQVDKVVQTFWNDRRNNWRKYLKERVTSLSIYGEALWPAYVNEINGGVHLGSAHPGIIETVFPNIRNNHEAELIKIKRGKDAKGLTVEEQIVKVIKVDTEAVDEDGQINKNLLKYNGDFFFFGINKPMENLRGVSDLYAIADWLDIYDQFIFNRSNRQAYMSTFLWDVTIEGAQKPELDRRLSQMILEESKQRSGRFYVHNEKEKRQAISPDLKADDATQDASSIQNMIWGGTGLSSQAFGDPGGSGRQSGGDVNEWVFKTLADRQYTWRDIILEVLDFVLDKAEIYNTIPSGLDRTVEVFMPKISMRDLQRLTQALRNVGTFAAQVEKATTVFNLEDKDKVRIKKVMHTLLDHIDQSSGQKMLHDVITGNDITEETLTVNRRIEKDLQGII